MNTENLHELINRKSFLSRDINDPDKGKVFPYRSVCSKRHGIQQRDQPKQDA